MVPKFIIWTPWNANFKRSETMVFTKFTSCTRSSSCRTSCRRICAFPWLHPVDKPPSLGNAGTAERRPFGSLLPGCPWTRTGTCCTGPVPRPSKECTGEEVAFSCGCYWRRDGLDRLYKKKVAIFVFWWLGKGGKMEFVCLCAILVCAGNFGTFAHWHMQSVVSWWHSVCFIISRPRKSQVGGRKLAKKNNEKINKTVTSLVFLTLKLFIIKILVRNLDVIWQLLERIFKWNKEKKINHSNNMA